MKIGRTTLLVLIASFAMLPVPIAFSDQLTVRIFMPLGGADMHCSYLHKCYDPENFTIHAGSTVEWDNIDAISHTVTSGSSFGQDSGKLFDSGIVSPKEKFTFTFNEPGEYDYFCQLHPWMAGHVTVITETSFPGRLGNNTIPEFSSLATMVTALSIIGVILISSKFRFHFEK